MTESSAKVRVALVTPVLNDWASLSTLLGHIEQLYDGSDLEFHLLAVDDGSTQDPQPFKPSDRSCIRRYEILPLATNMGHQRAIAMGLVCVSNWDGIDAVLIMDSDGEDRPEEIRSLIDTFREKNSAIILARRSKRSESLGFRLGYLAYRVLFWLMTGARLSSGNFSVVPARALSQLTHAATLWNNLPATLIRSRFRLFAVPTIRGTRYAGRSQMNTISLVIHGLSAISVYLDVIFVRLVILSVALLISAVAIIAAASVIRLFTDLAIPGWTTQIVSAFFIIMLQAAIFIVGITLMVLASRVQYTVIPALDWQRFVHGEPIVVWTSPELQRTHKDQEVRLGIVSSGGVGEVRAGS